MGGRRRTATIPILLLLITVSLLVGWFVPAFYDWTGSNQSRPSPLVGQIALGLVLGTIIIWAILPWVPLADEARSIDQSVRIRFTTPTMLMLTAVIAVLIAAIITAPMVVSGE